MKIVFLTVGLIQIGGVERVISTLANKLVENYDYEVEIISAFSNGSKDTLAFELNPKISTTFLNKQFIKTDSILKRIKEEYAQVNDLIDSINNSNADVCVLTNNFFNPFLFLKKRKLRCKLIFCEHVTHKQYTKIKNILNILTYRNADKVIVLSKKDAEFYSKYIKNVEIIHNPKFLEVKKKPQLKNKKIISAGRLVYVKGFDRLIEAFSLIADKNKDWTLEIVGSGGEKKKLVSRIKELGLEDQIKILPFNNNIVNNYLDSMIYALPSRDESFGLVLIEAMEIGLPCIAFDSFGPSEIITNNENGILVENNDIDGFSRELQRLINDEKLRDKLRKKAYKDIEKYEINTITEKWKCLFEGLN